MIVRFIGICLIFCSMLYSEDFPVAFKGRFRPAEAYARLWLYDLYHAQTIKAKDRARFSSLTGNPLDLILQLHLQGHQSFQDSPLFWISSADLKALLQIEPTQDRASYNELKMALNKPHVLEQLALYHFLTHYQDSTNRSRTEKLELKTLQSGLWAQFKGHDVILTNIPAQAPWNQLTPGQLIGSAIRPQAASWLKQQKKLIDEATALLSAIRQFEEWKGSRLIQEEEFFSYFIQLKQQGLPPKEIEQTLERAYPLTQRLRASGSLLKALPGRAPLKEWFSLHAFHLQVYHPVQNQLVPINNFTLFSNEDFEAVRIAYFKWEEAMKTNNTLLIQEKQNELFSRLSHAYQRIEGTVYQEAHGKALYYPSLSQLKLESFYFKYPFIDILLVLYGAAICVLILNRHSTKWGLALVLLAFLLHTTLLVLRSLILNRPPVSNMFETVIYVPWVTVAVSLFYRLFNKTNVILIASSLASMILLILIQLTDLNSSLDNVQAVLDSQFWLIIHVLMVVGSYGVFILGGILGHFYLGNFIFYRRETLAMSRLSQTILQTMYLGTALLITGTILGGIWAAESWGRFWDWDPKESWAFISSCIYLIWIHAYRFYYIRSFGLAIGSVLGLLAISFTWYGVNYILGTGLHSYGFGSGGEFYYYTFFLTDLIFVFWALWNYQTNLRNSLALK